MDDTANVVLVKLAALKASIDATIDGDISYTGTGLARTREYLSRFGEYRESLRVAAPSVFSDLPGAEGWYVSIASQKDALRDVNREMREIFTRARHAGLWSAEEPRFSSSSEPASPARGRSWLVDHLWQIAVGLVVGYLLFRFGWNR